MRFTKILTLFTVLLSFNQVAMANQCDPILADKKITQPYFWELNKDGKTSYALGTIHYGVSLAELPAFVTEALDKSFNILSEARAPEDNTHTLGQRLSPEELVIFKRILRARLKDGGERLIESGMVANLDPVTASALLYISETQLYDTLAKLLDHQILSRAKEMAKNSDPLDSSDQYIKATASVSEKYLDRILAFIDRVRSEGMTDQQIHDLPRLKEIDDAVRAYRNSQMELQTFEKDIDTENLLTNRNETWAKTIEETHKKGSLFIAGGVGHFVLSNNVLDKLQKRGFSIRRVIEAKPQVYGCLVDDYAYMVRIDLKKSEVLYKPSANHLSERTWSVRSVAESSDFKNPSANLVQTTIHLYGGGRIVIDKNPKEQMGTGYLIDSLGNKIGPFKCI